MAYALDGGIARLCFGAANVFLTAVLLIGIGYLIGIVIDWWVER